MPPPLPTFPSVSVVGTDLREAYGSRGTERHPGASLPVLREAHPRERYGQRGARRALHGIGLDRHYYGRPTESDGGRRREAPPPPFARGKTVRRPSPGRRRDAAPRRSERDTNPPLYPIIYWVQWRVGISLNAPTNQVRPWESPKARNKSGIDPNSLGDRGRSATELDATPRSTERNRGTGSMPENVCQKSLSLPEEEPRGRGQWRCRRGSTRRRPHRGARRPRPYNACDGRHEQRSPHRCGNPRPP